MDYVDRIDSTNEAIRRKLEAKTPLPSFYTLRAGRQYAGRGRGGKEWHDVPQPTCDIADGNLYMSVLYRVAKSKQANLPEIALVAGVALHQSLIHCQKLKASHGLTLKWPNDLLFHNKKISGTLIETVSVMENNQIGLIIGTGVNIINYPTHSDITYPITSLVEGGYFNPQDTPNDFSQILAQTYLERLKTLIPLWEAEGFSEIRDLWLAAGPKIGQPVRFNDGQTTIIGKFCGIDGIGALLLKNDDQPTPQRFLAGDCFPLMLE